jgi:hypothetical protein
MPMKTPAQKAALRATALSRLEEKIDNLAALRAQAKALDADIKDEQKVVLEGMDVLDIESHKTKAGNVAQVVAPVKVTIDTAMLAKKLGARLWARVTTRKLDNALLEDAIARNIVKPVDLAQCSTEEPGTRYIKVDPPKAPKGGKP